MFDFLESWSVFVQKLANIFGLYLLENDNDDVIITLAFPSNGKAINYFIQFTRYQNKIKWDNWSLYKAVKNAIPPRIQDKLCVWKENLSTFKAFKQAVIKIDNNYWKWIQEDKHWQHLLYIL